MDLTGQSILGYELQAMIGEGGMGAVYKGVQPELEQTVAVKVLDPILARDAELRERFIQEVTARLARLREQGDARLR